MGLQDFLDKYEVTGVDPLFVVAMDAGVAAALLTAWTAGTPVTGLLGPALGLVPGSLVMMPFMEADLTAALTALAAGAPPPGAPAVIPPVSPVAMLALATLNPLAVDKARKLANALIDWACAQAPPVPPAAKGPPAPWPPPFIAV